MLRLNGEHSEFHYRLIRLIINDEVYWGLLIDERCDENLVDEFNRNGFYIYETKEVSDDMERLMIEDRVLSAFAHTLILVKPIRFDDDSDKHISVIIDRLFDEHVGKFLADENFANSMVLVDGNRYTALFGKLAGYGYG